MDDKLGPRYRRTKAGRAQFREQTVPLSRPARNLLLMIDESHTGAQWVQLVQGSSAADLSQLISMRFVAALDSPIPAEDARRQTLNEALQRWGYDELSKFLTAEVRERFGLLRGYGMILKIEGCSGLDELRAVAVKFVESVQKSHGSDPAARLCRQLGAN